MSNIAASSLPIIDFHCHHVPRRFEVTAGKFAPAGQAARWDALGKQRFDESFLVRDIDEGNINGRVVNIPAAPDCRCQWACAA